MAFSIATPNASMDVEFYLVSGLGGARGPGRPLQNRPGIRCPPRPPPDIPQFFGRLITAEGVDRRGITNEAVGKFKYAGYLTLKKNKTRQKAKDVWENVS